MLRRFNVRQLSRDHRALTGAEMTPLEVFQVVDIPCLGILRRPTGME